MFSRDPADSEQAIFHPAVHVDDTAIQQVRDQLRRCGLRWLARHGYLDAPAAKSERAMGVPTVYSVRDGRCLA